MAATWDFHRPLDNPVAAVRELTLAPEYVDEWSGPQLSPDAPILDLGYDPQWTDIPADKPLVVDNLDPGLPPRIVINYIDHVQPIWSRLRAPVDDGSGTLVDNCLGCHSSQENMAVPAGQLELDALPSSIDPDHYRSYRELLDTDNWQWLDNAGVLATRERICSDLDEQGNTVTTIVSLPVAARMRAGNANGSAGFFDCFAGGQCGVDDAPPLPLNCTEDGGIVEPATRNTVDHSGMLSPAELRLLSEWLDIGGQYYNNPFDPRLAD